jgi:hypothetical protein
MKLSKSEPEDDLEEETEETEKSTATESADVDSESADVDSETDNIGDPSVEINVEDLIQELESQGLANRLGAEQAAKRRLEELMEQKRARRELEDFEDYEI